MADAGSAGLDRLERWMLAVVTHAGGSARGLRHARARRQIDVAVGDIERVVTRSSRLSAIERLDIYAEAYWLRLVEVMANEYPTTRDAMGERAFDAACRAYLARHPSTERLLLGLSAKFPDFLARRLRGKRGAALAVSLARIERAMEDVFDAPAGELLSPAAMAALPAAAWGRMRLELTPAMRLLALDCDANSHMTALRSRRSASRPRPRPAWVLVHRHGLRVLRTSLTREQYALLRLLGRGVPIGRAIARSCRDLRVSADRLPALLSGWFRDWAATGLFVAARVG